MNAVVEIQQSRAVVNAQTAGEIRAQVNRIQEVMQEVMKSNTHYGVIPGTQKPTLYKAGSEVLLSTFRIAVDPEVQDLSTSDEIRYRVRAKGIHQVSGCLIGVGVGECSSSEEKYRWRNAVCDEEFEDTEVDRRRVKYQKYKGNVERRKMIRTNPADVANTVLKMAKKRAQIDMTLTALAASDCFTQDIEDIPEEYRDTAAEAHEVPLIDEKQAADLDAKISEVGANKENFLKFLKVERLADLPASKYKAAAQALEDKAKGVR